jgi:hypothetical protein
MIATADIAQALEDWVVATLPDLQGSYDYQTAEKTQPLPDVAIEVGQVTTAESTGDASLESFGFGIEQTALRNWTVSILLMVPPEPGQEASAQLAGFIDTLQADILQDGTLGGRVPWSSKETRASFTPPFVQFDDGTRGRVVTLEVTVGERVPIEE